MRLSNSIRLVVTGFVALGCIASQSPCSGDNTRRFTFPGTGLSSSIPFTAVVPSVVGDATLVTAQWQQGLGCPSNLPAPYACFSSADPADAVNTGLLLAKTGPTTSDPSVDLSAYPIVAGSLAPYAVADLQGVAGATVAALTELGYDLRKPDFNTFGNPSGSHCGLRAPRFEVTTQGAAGSSVHRFYCPDGLMPVDPPNQGWIRLRWTPDQADPAMDPADIIQSIQIVFDEGQDPLGGAPDVFGVAILDNIDVNGLLIGSGQGAPTPPSDEDDGQGEDREHNCFHFHDSWTNSGTSRLSYSDTAARLKFVATTGARSLQSAAPGCVRFVADGRVNEKPGYSATLQVCDHSSTGTIGTFSIEITGPNGFDYRKSSTLSRGRLNVRR